MVKTLCPVPEGFLFLGVFVSMGFSLNTLSTTLTTFSVQTTGVTGCNWYSLSVSVYTLVVSRCSTWLKSPSDGIVIVFPTARFSKVNVGEKGSLVSLAFLK